MSNASEKDLASLEQLAAPNLQNTNAIKQGAKSKKTDSKKNEKAPKAQKSIEDNSKQQGKFVELPGAEMGKVVVRFPPEASGYLHIGHAKAALLNQHYQLAFNGRLIMRFDDTNPAKEKEDFEKVILEDVDMLKIKPDTFTYTSDHFDKMLDICENGMLKKGLAYVDDTDGDKIRLEREQRIDSRNRNNSIEKNLELWKQMILGTENGQKCCVRAKIDMQSTNGCLRDPTIYRCKPEHHPRTGDKYKVYPTYDFACPIVDSFEGVTHCLRTTEYTDRDAQYYWFCDALKLGTHNNETRPYVWSYSRLNMTNTVLSKRKLTWFVEQGHVDGWDDPRMPTVRGVFRRGMQVEALKQFIVAQGSSRTVTAMQWDKIWSLNRSIVDSIAPRHTTLLLSNSNKDNVVSHPPVEVVVENVEKPYKIDNVPKHPKNSQLGLKSCVWAAPIILIDYSDAELLEAGRHATFINWGNLLINRIERNQNNNKIERIYAVSDLGNTDFKSTVKVTWLPKTDCLESDEVLPILVPVVCVYFDHLISKAVLAKDDDFKQYLNIENSRWELQMIGDSELKDLKKGDVIQLQRRGYFICDSTYQPYSIHTGKETPLVLFNIPDGHTKSTTPITTVPIPITINNTKKITNKNVDTVISQINYHANKVDGMKADLEEAVKVLLALKADYKTITGVDFPASGIPTPQQVDKSSTELNKPSTDAIVLKINEQGDKVRSMKNNKASKAEIGEAVKVLLALKAEYKTITGVDFPASGIPTPQQADKSNTELSKPSTDAIVLKINEQGDKVRSMKNNKASKAEIGEAVKVLLALKADYKTITGVDFPASGIPTPQQVDKSNTELSNLSSADAIALKINEQGDKVRLMKSNNSSKTDIAEQVKVLLTLKNDYKSMTGKEYQPPTTIINKSSTTLDKKSKKKENTVTTTKTSDNTNTKKVTKLGLEVLKVSENLGEWYSQVLVKGEMIEYYDVSGCYVLRPWAYKMWELVQEWFDSRIKRNPLNVRNCYFPMFVSQGALEREKEHIADFAPEVAWVTKSGETDLAEPIAIRPTSETGMYPAFAKWIQSYRDLPLKLNQWNSVVRWEFKHPQPFLRTREFLWQEGHNAYATREEAERDVLITLGYYEYVYNKMLAVPVIKGKKTEKEKFAGGEFTTTCEAYVASSGRAIQGATSHYLGTNFAKMFDVHFEHPDTHEKSFVHQISFGMTTRTIGVMVMVHGDDRGLVLPPRIASLQVIIVPCGVGVSTANEVKDNLTRTCLDVCNRLKGENGIDDEKDDSCVQHRTSSIVIRADTDLRDNYSPGWKFNHWELKGVPLRLEIGPKDLDRNQMVGVRRDTGEKLTIPLEECPKNAGENDKMVVRITEILNQIQNDMYARAEQEMKKNVVICRKWSECAANLAAKHLLLIPFCGRPICEDNIKRDTTLDDGTAEVGASTMGAKSLCVPFEQPKGEEKLKSNDQCIHPECGQPAGSFTLFGRSY